MITTDSRLVITNHEQGKRVHSVAIDPRNGRYVVGMAPASVLSPLIKLYRFDKSGRWVDEQGHEWEPYLSAGTVIRWRHAATCVCKGARPL